MKPYSVDWQLLQAIRQEGPIAQHRLAEAAGLRRSTVNGAVRRLLDEGWIEEAGRLRPGRGRPAILLEVRRTLGYFVGVDLAGRQFHAAAVTADGEEAGRATAGLGRDRDPEAVADQIDLAVRGMLSRLNAARDQLLGLWIGVRGVVDARGRVVTSAALGWHDVPLAELLGRHFDGPIIVRGGASVQSAGAEALIGAGRGAESMVYFQAGDGISARLVRAGQLLSGATQRAGEVGHVVVEPGGRRCGCGNRGCLETVASGPALVRALAAIPDRHWPPDIHERLRSSRIRREGVRPLLRDAAAVWQADRRHPAHALFEETASRLAWGASVAISAYDPEVLVLGGYLFQDHPQMVRMFERMQGQFVMDWKQRPVRVAVAQLPAEDRALAGAIEACQRYWSGPPASALNGASPAGDSHDASSRGANGVAPPLSR